MGPRRPAGLFLVDQLQIGFVDERGGVERVVALPASALPVA
jgi:hypothetical protein